MKHTKDYNQFIEKFKTKKTTDDCYTPPKVYQVVLDYVKEKCNIQGLNILRPFYPDRDYKKENYDNSVVIDNPPFSILSEIIRFYLKHDIKFFLFAPYLTLFSSNQDYTAIVTHSDITYQNGAKVKTSFVSNLFGDSKIIGCPILSQRLNDIQKEDKTSLPKYQYPDNVITVSHIGNIVSKGGYIDIKTHQVQFIRALESQKPFKKAIYGSGFLISDKVVSQLKEKEQIIKQEAPIKYWPLSEKEQHIIKNLNDEKQI